MKQCVYHELFESHLQVIISNHHFLMSLTPQAEEVKKGYKEKESKQQVLGI